MRWHTSLAVLWALGFVTITNGVPYSFVPENYFEDIHPDKENIDSPRVDLDNVEDEQLDKIDNILVNLLMEPWPQGISPIIYVENNPMPVEDELLSNSKELNESPYPVPLKRTRYYRRYPWKRQNARYEPGNRFLCTPSKEDVYRLLVALHEARQGNRDRVVNFCNRKRPAYAVFTNIRFMGK